MNERAEKFYITPEHMNKYLLYLVKKGYTGATIEEYSRNIAAFNEFTGGAAVTNELVEGWKNKLAKKYSAASVNLKMASVKSLADFLGFDIKIRRLKAPYHSLIVPQENEITKAEYEKLLKTAKELGAERLALIMRTICATGIQVSELNSVTVEAVGRGEIEMTIRNKLLEQKIRTVQLSGRIRQELLSYAERENIRKGCIFITRNGTPVHRSNVWNAMKRLCESAGVEPSKVFPQNLRYLSVRTFYDEDRGTALFTED